jgi:hypothetical protein
MHRVVDEIADPVSLGERTTHARRVPSSSTPFRIVPPSH